MVGTGRPRIGRVNVVGKTTAGFLQGAWFEGQTVGKLVAGCLSKTRNCPGMKNYTVLHGTQQLNQYNEENGWMVTSFQTIGF